jgi:hypothetical protein
MAGTVAATGKIQGSFTTFRVTALYRVQGEGSIQRFRVKALYRGSG